MMAAEEIRGPKRRKQANPRRNQVDIERASSLGSEGEDEVGLWSLEPQDCQESLEKTSLTPSEGTEEPGSPAARSGRPRSLSPDGKNHWAAEAEAPEAEGDAAAPAPPLTDREEEHASPRMYGQNTDSQNALEDLAQYDILVQLRKASNPASLLDHPHLPHNGSATMYHPGSRLDELPPAMWSPGSHQRSPEGHDAHPLSPDTLRMQQACPFCHRTYQRGASLREHIKYCQEREGSHMVCPLCGYTATYRAQMERHVALHNQIQDKNSLALDHGTEARKFKCLQCGKAFKYKHHLKEHLRIHSGEKPYECPNCKKRFSHSGSYSSHLSSKKCLSGGGNGGSVSGGGGGGIFNGHGQNSYPHHSSPTSPPPAGGGRTSNGRGSPFPSQTQDYVRPLGQMTEDAHHHISAAQENHHNPMVFPRAADLARLWDPMAGALKGTTLLPYLPSGAKFEQMLQEMLHREVKQEEGRGGGGVGVDEGRVNYNGGGHDGKVSPDRSVKRERAKSSEGDRGVFAVTCRWCSQLFPNTAVLLQHERYLCKMNREAAEMPDVPHGKDHLSPTFFFGRTSLQGTENSKPSGVANGLSEDKSPVQKPNWHSVPQQLLVAMHSPSRHRPEPLPSRPYWSSLEGGSPGQPISPSTELSSPQTRRRVPSTGFGSPLCLDLSVCPPDFSSPQKRPCPQNRSPWSAGSQNEPLDLSLPKPPTDQEGGSKTVHDKPSRGEKRELEKQHLRKMSPSQPQHLALHQLYGGSAGPVFGGSMYNGFPVFNPMLQASLGGPGHESITSLSLSHPASSPGFLSPMTYMMETDTDAMLKKIHQERQALMGEVLSHGGLDYLSLMEDGMDGEGGPGRKRLKKTEEGLYACDICEKTFQKSSSLLRHKYEHTGKRPHECKICNKAFKHKHHLIEHSRLHSGEKPYQCDKCGKRFSHSGSYSQHMNHRYAYCSRDQDPDQDPEEPPLTPGTGNDLGGALSLSAEDAQTPHLFLSDSSLDGGPGGLREEEEEEVEEDKEERPRDDHALSLSEEAEERLGRAEPDHVQELPEKLNGEQNAIDSNNTAKHVGAESTEHHLWDQETDQQNGETGAYDLSLDTTVSQ